MSTSFEAVLQAACPKIEAAFQSLANVVEKIAALREVDQFGDDLQWWVQFVNNLLDVFNGLKNARGYVEECKLYLYNAMQAGLEDHSNSKSNYSTD